MDRVLTARRPGGGRYSYIDRCAPPQPPAACADTRRDTTNIIITITLLFLLLYMYVAGKNK